MHNEIQSKNLKINFGDLIDLGEISVTMRFCTERTQNRGQRREFVDVTMNLPVP
jgi:hypothetical protein